MVEFYNTYKDDEIVTPLVTQITWTNHLVILLRAKLPDKNVLQNRLRKITELVMEEKQIAGK